MATIDDFGGTTDPLNAPPLGGPAGWAAAVRDYIKDLPTQIAGKVSKSGDTMTGQLHVPSMGVNGNALVAAPIPGQLGLYNADGSALAPTFLGSPTDASHAATKGYVDAFLGSPTDASHAATKGYVDGHTQAGNAYSSDGGLSTKVTFPVPFVGNPSAIVITPIAGITDAIPTLRSWDSTGFVFSVVNKNDTYVAVQVFWVAVGAV